MIGDYWHGNPDKYEKDELKKHQIRAQRVDEYKNKMLTLNVGDQIERNVVLNKLVDMLFERNDFDFKRGSFRVRGDVLEIIPINEHAKGVRVEFFDDEIERIRTFDVTTGKAYDDVKFINIFAATHFVTNKDKLAEAIRRIKEELKIQHKKFILEGKPLEAERIDQRTRYDMEQLLEFGAITKEAAVFLQKLVKRVYMDDSIKKYIIAIINATRYPRNFIAPELAQYVTMGSSTRGAIALMEVSKARAVMCGRNYVTPDDVKALIYSVLRHRIALNYAAVADDITQEHIINAILGAIPTP